MTDKWKEVCDFMNFINDDVERVVEVSFYSKDLGKEVVIYMNSETAMDHLVSIPISEMKIFTRGPLKDSKKVIESSDKPKVKFTSSFLEFSDKSVRSIFVRKLSDTLNTYVYTNHLTYISIYDLKKLVNSTNEEQMSIDEYMDTIWGYTISKRMLENFLDSESLVFNIGYTSRLPR